MILRAIIISFGIWATVTTVVCALLRAERREREEAEERQRRADLKIIREQEEKRARGSELLERLQRAYKKAKRAGVHNFYLLAVSHCCQLIQNGEDIDEGAALLALRGLEGDATLDAMVAERLKAREAGE